MALEPMTPPATRSEWPPTYLVSEYMTRSAPCSSGRWNTGPRNVLSTATGGRAALLLADPLRRLAPQREIDEAVGRIGRCLGHDQPHLAAVRLGLLERGFRAGHDRLAVDRIGRRATARMPNAGMVLSISVSVPPYSGWLMSRQSLGLR